MPRTDPTRDLELLIRARQGLIVLDSPDDARVATLVRHVADRAGLPLFLWNRARGLERDGAAQAVYGTADVHQLLAHIAGARIAAVYLLQGDGALTDAAVVPHLREAAARTAEAGGAIVMAADTPELPADLRRSTAQITLPPPDIDEFRELLARIVRDHSARMPVRVQLSADESQRLLGALRGLTLMEAEKVLTKAIIEDGLLGVDDLRHVLAAKQRIVEREGVLEYYPAEEALDDVADLAGLKDWLEKRRQIVAEPDRAREFGLTFPKGILLIGVPGCGKSLCARAVAGAWGLPLLKLDPGRLYNKYIGESERNFRRACATAERLAPVVLFIDELEKAFATGGSQDGGLSQRVFGSFLAWLQDRRADVFTVATANDVSRLPPEFLRKGRFDEIFFVDLPDAASRHAILDIHLRRRDRDPADFAVAEIVAATDTFSGAELEQVVVAALYSAFAAGGELTTALLLEEARNTRPLATMMAERIAALREWATERTVPAN